MWDGLGSRRFTWRQSMRILSALAFPVVLSAAFSSPLHAQQTTSRLDLDDEAQARWVKSYDPDTFTAVDVPTGVFSVAEGDPEAGTGRRLRTEDGRAHLSIYLLSNRDRETPGVYVRNHLKYGRADLDYSR